MRRRGFMRLVLPPGPIADFDILADRLALLFGHDLGDQPKIVSNQLRAMRATDLTTSTLWMGSLRLGRTLIAARPTSSETGVLTRFRLALSDRTILLLIVGRQLAHTELLCIQPSSA